MTSSVTLVSADCQLPALAARALRLSLREREYAAALLFTDAGVSLPELDPRIRAVPIRHIGSAAEYSRFILKDLIEHVDTDFVQIVQWDGYVTRREAWDDAFLDYDYIGARWWFREPPCNVGNGGFSLRSRRLLEALRDGEIAGDGPEDDTICLTHRDLLERRYGIRIAPGEVADRYAFEGVNPTGKEFGFHRVFNLPYFHGEAELAALLAEVPDRVFCAAPTVTLVDKLIVLGRKREALAYAKRLRACGYAELDAEFRARLLQMARFLVGRTHPCPCGSGQQFKRCCGTIDAWA